MLVLLCHPTLHILCIHSDIASCAANVVILPSGLQWPNQPPPTQEMWTVFRQVIKRVFCSGNKYIPTRLDVPLDKPLGKWFKVERNTLSRYYRTSETIFHRNDDGTYHRYTEKPGSNYYVLAGTRDNLPPEAHPIDCTQKNGKYFPGQEFAFVPPPPPTVIDIDDELETDDLDYLRVHLKRKKCHVERVTI
jgi:hypothetical protein